MILNDLMIWEKTSKSLSHWLREEKYQVSGKVYSDLHKNKRWKQPDAYFTGYWYQKPVASQSMIVNPPEPNTLSGLISDALI